MQNRPLSTLALGAALTLPAAASPLAAHAGPLSVFQPTQVRAVSVTPSDVHAIRALPPLEAFGTIRGTRSPGIDEVGSAAEAAQEAGYALRAPASVPSGLAGDPHYQVTHTIRSTFTFSQAKAAAWAREHRVALRPLPSGLDGATYTVTIRPLVLTTYGTMERSRRGAGARKKPFLAIMQAPVPTVSSSGPPLQTLTSWFAAQPGIPKHLAAELAALGDPAQTLPIPIRFNEQTAAKIAVDGAQGLAIGDETGIGSVVVWTKDGRLYAVAGTLPQTDVLAIANGLR